MSQTQSQVYNVTTNTVAVDQIMPGETVSVQYKDKLWLIAVGGMFKSTTSNLAYQMDNFNSTITWVMSGQDAVSADNAEPIHLYTIAITNESKMTVSATVLLHLINYSQP